MVLVQQLVMFTLRSYTASVPNLRELLDEGADKNFKADAYPSSVRDIALFSHLFVLTILVSLTY